MNDDERGAIERVQRTLVDTGITQILVEHHMGMIHRTCTEVWVLNSGALIARGTPTEVAADPGVREAYLGESA
jgi:ABC-type branched-subunit amino acid transport system ATPase component